MPAEDEKISTDNNNNSKKNTNNKSHFYDDNYDISESFMDAKILGRAIPEDLQKVLVDFSVACLVNQPKDYIDYGVKYFRAVQAKRLSPKRSLRKLPIPSTLSLVKITSKYFGKLEKKELSTQDLNCSELLLRNPKNFQHRRSVYATSYDLDDDIDDDGNLGHETDDEVEQNPKTVEQQQRLRNYLNRVFNFRPIDPNVMDLAISAMYERRFIPGEYVIKVNDNTNQNFYVVEFGRFDEYVNDRVIKSYKDAGFFGEMALLYNTEANSDIKAETAGMLWVMNGPTFQRILLRSSAQRRRVYETLLQSVPILKVLKRKEILNLADALIPRFYKKDEVIIKQGEEGDGMYFIEDGQVAVKKEMEPDQGEIYLVSLKRGDYFGEIALLTNGPRMASIYAETDTRLAFLEKKGFERLLGKCITLLRRGMKEYNDPKLKSYLDQFESIAD